jgi:pilus assembly protein CpaE
MSLTTRKLSMPFGWSRSRRDEEPAHGSRDSAAVADPTPITRADMASGTALDPSSTASPDPTPMASVASPAAARPKARRTQGTKARRAAKAPDPAMASAATSVSATDEAPARPRRRRAATSRTAASPAAAPPAQEPTMTGEMRPIRILLVEDVDDVASHVREVLRAQGVLRLVGTIRDGRNVVDEVRELRPDVVVVDTLLQGRVKGPEVVRRIRDAGLPVGIVALTVPDQPVEPENGVDSVLNLPCGTYDVRRAIGGALDASAARDPSRTCRAIAVFGSKGGVGKSTIAFNLAASLARSGLRTALVDGSLQYGDIRHLLRVPSEQPSICDLPTDCVRGSDLAETLLSESGVDVLLAPPRPEMAELITARDLEAVLDLLRRSYQAIVIDTPAALVESNLALLDTADVILQVVTPEVGALDATRTATDTFAALGYASSKIRLVVNRAGTRGALTRAQIERSLGRPVDAEIPSEWDLVSSCNAEGVPFVLDRPDAAITGAIDALAASVSAVVGAAAQPGRTRRPGQQPTTR